MDRNLDHKRHVASLEQSLAPVTQALVSDIVRDIYSQTKRVKITSPLIYCGGIFETFPYAVSNSF